MNRYWIAVASQEHVHRGIEGGFMQVCHGKKGPLMKMQEGDWVLYYSSKLTFREPSLCQKFTAIGFIAKGEPYLHQMSEDFTPWRRDVIFIPAREASIKPLIDKLSFIKDKKHWGFPFRKGFFSIPFSDFCLIAACMGVEFDGRISGYQQT